MKTFKAAQVAFFFTNLSQLSQIQIPRTAYFLRERFRSRLPESSSGQAWPGMTAWNDMAKERYEDLNAVGCTRHQARRAVIFLYFRYMYSTARILEILKDRKTDLQKRYPISELGLFGSYARGDFNEQSYIDILVDFNGRIGIKFISLAHELEDIFHTKIDLVSRKGIKPKYLPLVEKSLIHV